MPAASLPLPEGTKRVFPENLTSDQLCAFWFGIREEPGPRGLRIQDCRQIWATQGVMNGVANTAVGRLLAYCQGETAANYAHLDCTRPVDPGIVTVMSEKLRGRLLNAKAHFARKLPRQ